MVTYLTHQQGEIFPYSPNIDLSDKLSLNLKAQSILQRSVNISTEELEVAFRAMPSSMFECLFEGDLPEVKGQNLIFYQ